MLFFYLQKWGGVTKVVILEDDPDLRSLLGQILKFNSPCESLAVASLDEMKKCRDEVLGSNLCLLDIDLGVGKPTGLDAFEWLSQLEYSGKIFFLTGHARSHPLVVKARK